MKKIILILSFILIIQNKIIADDNGNLSFEKRIYISTKSPIIEAVNSIALTNINLNYKIELVSEYFSKRIEFFKTYYVVKYNGDSLNILKLLNSKYQITNFYYDIKLNLNYSPNDPDYTSNNLWQLDKIGAKDAWNNSKGNNQIISVIDAGFNIDHEDLTSNIFLNPNEIANDGIDNDNNGYIDDIHGWDFSGNDNNLKICTGTGNYRDHGTNVSGCAAATTDNNTGISSVGFNAKILPLKIWKDNGNAGSTNDVVKAFEYSDLMNVRIINLSWSSWYFDEAIYQIINYLHKKNVIIIAASGNYPGPYTSDYEFPAYLKEVIAVSATNDQDGKSGFLYGPHVDICAPGVSIKCISGINGNSCSNNNYITGSGTSLSTPIVSGAVALLLAIDNNLTFDEVKSLLQRGCDPLINLPIEYENMVGSGRLNIKKSIEKLQVKPDFDFDCPYQKVCFGQSMQFNYRQFEGVKALSSNNQILWKLIKDGNVISQSNLEFPLFNFLNTGEYDISLTLTNSYGSKTITKNKYIKVVHYTNNFTGNEENNVFIQSHLFNFNQNPYNFKKVDHKFFNNEIECISNQNGEILFYCDNKIIYNRYGNPISEKEIYSGGFDFNEDNQSASGYLNNNNVYVAGQNTDYGSGQNKVIVPTPGRGKRTYTIFHISQYEKTQNINSNTNLFYTVIDMDLNNGLGGIMSDNNGLIINRPIGNSIYTQCISAIPNCNFEKIWIITNKRSTSAFHIYEIQLNNPIPSLNNVSGTSGNGGVATGHFQLKSSPDGNSILVKTTTGRWNVFKFNRENGIIDASPLTTHLSINNSNSCTPILANSCEFSPNGENIYLSTISFFNNNKLFGMKKNNNSFNCQNNQINGGEIIDLYYDNYYSSSLLMPNSEIFLSRKINFGNNILKFNWTSDIKNPNDLSNISSNSMNYNLVGKELLINNEITKEYCNATLLMGDIFPNNFISKTINYLHNYDVNYEEKIINVACNNFKLKIQIPNNAPTGATQEIDLNGYSFDFVNNNESFIEIPITKSGTFIQYIKGPNCYFKKIKYIINYNPINTIYENLNLNICDIGQQNPVKGFDPCQIFGTINYKLGGYDSRVGYYDPNWYNGPGLPLGKQITGCIWHALIPGNHTLEIFDDNGCLIKVINITVTLNQIQNFICENEVDIPCETPLNEYHPENHLPANCPCNGIEPINWLIYSELATGKTVFEAVIDNAQNDDDLCKRCTLRVKYNKVDPQNVQTLNIIANPCVELNLMTAFGLCLDPINPFALVSHYKMDASGNKVLLTTMPLNSGNVQLCCDQPQNVQGSHIFEVMKANGCICRVIVNLICQTPPPGSIEEQLTINTLKNNQNLLIVPNPTSSIFRIINSTNKNTIYDLVEVMDYTGKVISSFTNINSDYKYNLSEYSKGIYLIRVKTGNNYQQLKLVLQ